MPCGQRCTVPFPIGLGYLPPGIQFKAQTLLQVAFALSEKTFGSLSCDTPHVSPPVFSGVNKPVLFCRDFTALSSPGKLLYPELAALSHQPCLQS